MTLSPLAIAIIIIVVVVLIGGGLIWSRRRRSSALHDRFGSEYERTVKAVGSTSKAEAVLAEREKRVEEFSLQPLPPAQREGFVGEWRQVQAQFVDDPQQALGRADVLLGEVMAARGYPVSDFEQRAADLSVDHAEVVENYRAAHDIALKHKRGEASTEDLRQAMIHYRALFDDLVNEPEHMHHRPSRSAEPARH
ncbi:MAG: hypothetical protein JF593_06020 [Novosphingobium sp.]|nr:hypothetical protein [Novosphingobium sp.]